MTIQTTRLTKIELMGRFDYVFLDNWNGESLAPHNRVMKHNKNVNLTKLLQLGKLALNIPFQQLFITMLGSQFMFNHV